MTPTLNILGLVGTGVMGSGIAQIAAQAGSQVLLFDVNAAAVAQAHAGVLAQWDKLLEKGRIDATQHLAYKSRLRPAATLADLAACGLVIEAAIERLDIKRALFAELEGIVGPDAVLATNTSSLSVTAIGAGLQRPQRLAGFHFFNPVPLMKIVEVVRGELTDPQVIERLVTLAGHAGHFAATTPDSPGFLVNHAGRAFGPEALRILGEGIATPAQIDRILKDCLGFRMGPFELVPRHLPCGDGVASHPVLPGSALHPIGAGATPSGQWLVGAQNRAGLLSLPGWQCGRGSAAGAAAGGHHPAILAGLR